MGFIKPKLTRDSVLRFTPHSWAKMLYFRDIGPTEVGGYGICETEDPLLVTDICLIKQECTPCTIDFDKQDMADFMEKMTDKGLSPWMHQNIFWHTHPGNCAKPSGTDEQNFDKAFSHPHWAIFFILAKQGDTYARLRYNVGPGTEVLLDYCVDYSIPFVGSNHQEWDKEYKDKVTKTKPIIIINNKNSKGSSVWFDENTGEILDYTKSGYTEENINKRYDDIINDLNDDEDDDGDIYASSSGKYIYCWENNGENDELGIMYKFDVENQTLINDDTEDDCTNTNGEIIERIHKWIEKNEPVSLIGV